MSFEAFESGSREERLGEVLTALLEAFQDGPAPDRQTWLTRHPEFAVEVEELFTARAHLDRWAAPLRSAVRTPFGPPTDTSPTGAAPKSLPLSPGHLLGDYEVLEEIGAGGMGVVYRARQKSLDRLVALKWFRAGRAADAADLERFRNEARTVADLDHPHIVPVYEVAEHDGQLFFSMKLVAGVSLDRQLGTFAADPRAAARLVATVARAVDHAHQRGVLHRDLKPSNILLDEAGLPHVTDFGLAKRVADDSGLTQTGQLVGTPSYMAPEQAAGQRQALTTAADVYGLGAVLYALLTGRPPCHGATVLETLEQVKGRDPEPPRRVNGRVPRDLETICLKCLAKDPRKRYGGAAALADDLERFLSGEPIQARPAGWWERLVKWVRRRPVLATLLAVSLTALVGLVAASTWYTLQLEAALRAVRERERAMGDRLYASDLRLAHEFSWKTGYVRQVRERLERHRPRPGDAEDRRDFAWYYVHHLTHRSDPTTLRGHDGPVHDVRGVTYTPGGSDRAVENGKLAHARRAWCPALAPQNRKRERIPADGMALFSLAPGGPCGSLHRRNASVWKQRPTWPAGCWTRRGSTSRWAGPT